MPGGVLNQPAGGVLVERVSGLVLLAKMAASTAASALKTFSAKLNSITQLLRKTMTYDPARELARHALLAAQTGVKVYFSDPQSPWQQGTCENTNDLLRRYIPKGADLSAYSQEQLDVLADQLYRRPCARHDFRSPLHACQDILLAQSQAQPAVKH